MKGPSVDQGWQARQDMQTLHEAMKIKKDKKRFAAARKVVADTAASMDQMAGVPKGYAKRKGK